MKKYGFGDLLLLLVMVGVLVAILLGGLYIVGTLVELIASVVSPLALSASSIVFMFIMVTLAFEGKI